MNLPIIMNPLSLPDCDLLTYIASAYHNDVAFLTHVTSRRVEQSVWMGEISRFVGTTGHEEHDINERLLQNEAQGLRVMTLRKRRRCVRQMFI